MCLLQVLHRILVIFHVNYTFGLFVMFVLFPYFTPKLFCFLCIYLLFFLCAFSVKSLVEFSFIILECSVLFVLLNSVTVSFKFSFFGQHFSLQVVFLDLSAISFWSFHPNISMHAFPSLVLSLVIAVSLPVFLA